MNNPTHATWSHTAWERGGITCVRASEKGDVNHIRRTLHKAQATVDATRQRVLVVVEHPHREKKKPNEAQPKNLNLTRVVDALAGAVKGKQILDFPPGTPRGRQNLGKKTATTLSPPTPKTAQQQRPMKDGRCSEQTKEPFM